MTEVFWVPSPKYTAGHPAPLRAIVHHRMVGTLKSTDATFANVSGRQASTNFGIGYGCGKLGHPEGAHVHQYVRLGDQAWGNGNWDKSGKWDDRYPTAYLNSQTVSIEHHDNGGLSSGDPRKGVVPEHVIEVSIELDRLLLSGNLVAMKAAGIVFRSNGVAFAAELAAIVPGPDTIIDHHYIAGRLKPYCWRPWAGDSIGFPQARYLGALVLPPDTGTEDQMEDIRTYTSARVVAVPDGAVLYPTADLDPNDPKRIVVSPGRLMPYIGSIRDGAISLVAYVSEKPGTTTDVYYIERSKLPLPIPVPPPEYLPTEYPVTVTVGPQSVSGTVTL